jgi:phospholipid/cholesterol/gamma-HCH transport system substrate-binding protein
VDTGKLNSAVIKAVAARYATVTADYMRGLSRQTLNMLLGGAVFLVGAITLVLSQGEAAPKAGGGYELHAQFGSVDGVNKGTKVLLTGIEVGEVIRRAYEPDRQRALLVMSLRSDIEIPNDSVAMIVSDGLMGNKYVKIQPGGALDTMQDGDTFEYVQDSIIFEEILEKVILNAEQKQKQQQQRQEQEKKPEPDRDAVKLKQAPTRTTFWPQMSPAGRQP